MAQLLTCAAQGNEHYTGRTLPQPLQCLGLGRTPPGLASLPSTSQCILQALTTALLLGSSQAWLIHFLEP